MKSKGLPIFLFSPSLRSNPSFPKSLHNWSTSLLAKADKDVRTSAVYHGNSVYIEVVMRYRTWILLACLSPLTGCHLYRNIKHNIHNEISQFHDDEHIDKQLRKEARIAFNEMNRQYPHRCFGDDFRDGFIDGYTEYLDRGGNADLPAMPPVKYRRHTFFNAEGHARIKDYFLGYKYGLDVALATGCRQFYQVPILIGQERQLPPLDINVIPPPPDANAPMPQRKTPAPSTSTEPTTPMPKSGDIPGLGNPVKDPAPPSNTVPVPAVPGGNEVPNPLPGKLPEKPAGRSARKANPPSPILPVSGILIPESDAKGASPIFNVPKAPNPIFDVPVAPQLK
jgi:hypothetical protein